MSTERERTTLPIPITGIPAAESVQERRYPLGLLGFGVCVQISLSMSISFSLCSMYPCIYDKLDICLCRDIYDFVGFKLCLHVLYTVSYYSDSFTEISCVEFK